MSSMVDFVFSCFCRQPIERYFIVDLLRQVVVSSTEEVNFFLLSWLEISHSIFFSPELVFFSNKVIYCTLISVCLYFSLFFFFMFLSSTYSEVLCHRLIAENSYIVNGWVLHGFSRWQFS